MITHNIQHLAPSFLLRVKHDLLYIHSAVLHTEQDLGHVLKYWTLDLAVIVLFTPQHLSDSYVYQ